MSTATPYRFHFVALAAMAIGLSACGRINFENVRDATDGGINDGASDSATIDAGMNDGGPDATVDATMDASDADVTNDGMVATDLGMNDADMIVDAGPTCAVNNGGCDMLSICTDVDGGTMCGPCPSGYTGDGTVCTDINECLTPAGACGMNGMCVNMPGTFMCVCITGYSGDGITCVDINECATANGGCGQTCTNSVGSYMCSCMSGFVLNADAHQCDDINECLVNNGGCDVNANCTNTPGSFSCTCGSEYTGNGYACLPRGNQIIGAIDFSCQLSSDGTVSCWGANNNGQLGSGDNIARYGPSKVLKSAGTPLTGAVQIISEATTACALINDGSVWCWGINTLGQLGYLPNNFVNSTFAVPVFGVTNAMSIVGGYAYACAILADATMVCWGSNGGGQIGDGTTSAHSIPVSPSNISNVQAAALGVGHTCVIFTDGTVYCWGTNNIGQLGDGTMSNRFTPNPTPTTLVPITLPSSSTPDTAVQIAAGNNFTCVLTASDNVWCWGTNLKGQFGNGTLMPASSATPVQSLASGQMLTAIYGGTNATTNVGYLCGLKPVMGFGVVPLCWGYDGDGQTGNQTTLPAVVTPTPALNITNVISIGLGPAHMVALYGDNSEMGWGDFGNGKLGDGTSVGSLTSVARGASIPNATSVAAGGAHSCAISGANHTVSCWGDNSFGQLGNSLVGINYSAPDPTTITNASKLELGDNFSCALKSTGHVVCWGGNEHGQVGANSGGAYFDTPQTLGLTNIVDIAVGQFHACAVDNTGAVYCWGDSTFRQLGDAPVMASYQAPALIADAPPNVVAVAAGARHTCVLTQAHEIYCWGANSDGQLGMGLTDGTRYFAAQSMPVMGVGTIADLPVAITAGGINSGSTCAITQSGAVYCWGDNANGQLGTGDTVSPGITPVLSMVMGATSLSLGEAFSCATIADGHVECFGRNAFAGLGNGGGADSFAPTAAGIVGADSVSVSDSSTPSNAHACAHVAPGNTVSCWGLGLAVGNGQLSGVVTTPTQVWYGWN